MVAVAFGARVYGEMLGAGGGLRVIGIIALHTLNKADAEAARQERILAVKFRGHGPSEIAEDVDVGGPDGQTLENVAVAVGAAHIVLAASLNADGVADLLPSCPRRGGGHADGLGEDGGSARAADTVDALAPPVVSRDAQTLDRGASSTSCTAFSCRVICATRSTARLRCSASLAGFLVLFIMLSPVLPCRFYRALLSKMVNTLSVPAPAS